MFYRNKYDAAQQDYLDQLYKNYGQIPANHQMAMQLRMQFFQKYVLDRRVSDYTSPTEKDWMYVARNEYYYDVHLRSGCDAAAAGLTAAMCRMFMVKKMIFWPIVPVALVVYTYRTNQLFAFYNKKFFDMCNVGEQYEVGFARNVVLRQCNKLLDREDF